MIFSVIIPAYNVASHIQSTLFSLECQHIDFEDFEVIVVNDGSTDGTRSVIENFACKTQMNINVHNQENGGVSTARNIGLLKASAEYIYFLDGDDFVAPDFLNLMKQKIEKFEPQLLVSSYTKIVDSNPFKAFLNDFDSLEAERFKLDYLAGRYAVNMCTLVFRAADIQKWKLTFDSSTRYGEDVEFYQKFMLRADSIVSVADAMFYYVERRQSASFNCDGRAREEALIALNRVRKQLSVSCLNTQFKVIYDRVFFPTHVLRIASRLAAQGDFSSSTYISRKYAQELRESDLKGKQALKAKLATLSPELFSAVILSTRLVRGRL